MNNSGITERNGPTTQMSEVAENNHNWKCANNGYLKSNNQDAITEQVFFFFFYKIVVERSRNYFCLGWPPLGDDNSGGNGGANVRKCGEDVPGGRQFETEKGEVSFGNRSGFGAS